MSERACGTCTFCDMKKPEDTFCRRYPPTLVVIGAEIRRFFPAVHPVLDWCGEYKAKKVPKKMKAPRSG